MEVEDRGRAKDFLQTHSYYRVIVYRFSFQDEKDRFRRGTRFDDLTALYLFDLALRRLLFSGLTIFELAFREHFSFCIGRLYGALPFESARFLHRLGRADFWQKKVTDQAKQSGEPFVRHFNKTHHQEIPPVYALFEILTFGQLSRLFADLHDVQLRKKVAQDFMLREPVFQSFLAHAVFLRNLCAHHSYLWGRKLEVTPKLPKKSDSFLDGSINRNKHGSLYNSVVLLLWVVKELAGGTCFARSIRAFFEESAYPVSRAEQPNLTQLGFPSDWLELDIWKTDEAR
ncbi:MAG: Abi family protein [Parvularcula sp.]|nr:Abi family protein [Parvularcula sp.]